MMIDADSHEQYDIRSGGTKAMRIESAQDLKGELLVDLPSSTVGTHERVALGIAPGLRRGEYKLAVRVPRDGDRALIDRIIKHAASEVDVREVGTIEVGAPSPIVASRQVLRCGVSVSHYRVSAGTLGFFARRVRDGAVGFVSCNHVIAAQDSGCEGDEILHPASADKGRKPGDVVGYLDGNYVRLVGADVVADCAFARLASGVNYEQAKFDLGPVVNSELPELLVRKVGRTTKETVGRITAFDLDWVEIEYAFGPIVLRGQIEVESAQDVPFSRPGDSGSLAVTDDNRPLGLVCASSSAGGAGNWGLTYLNPIDTVLSALGVQFLQ